MSVSSDHDRNYEDEPATVYPVAGCGSHEAVPAAEIVTPIAAAVCARPTNPQGIEATSIRWGWWAIGLGISAVLWACVAISML